MKRFLVLFSIILLLGMGIGIFILMQPLDTAPVPSNTNTPITTSRLTVSETDPFKGRRDAPVTLIVVSSFGCPACKNASVALDQLLALYPESLRVVWKDLPETTGDSYRAAVAARCAQQQGRFWQYHDILFAKQDVLFTETLYKLWAAELNLRQDEFNRCFDEGRTQKLIDDNTAESLAAGFTAIPYFQINDQEGTQGFQPVSYFRGAIDAELQEDMN